MRIWIDLTNSPHVLVLRPVISELKARGHDVVVTARDFAQTVGLCEKLGIEATVIGHHRGEKLAAKAVGLADRSLSMIRFARSVGGASRPGKFDLAIGHGSNDISVAAKTLRIPITTSFDYEWAKVQHQVNCRLADAVVVPAVIPAERLYPYGAKGKIVTYEGLKEEYYLSDLQPDHLVLEQLGLDARQPIAVVRTPPEVSLYHRFENSGFADVLLRLREQGQVVVLPRTQQQREELQNEPGFIVPTAPIDAPSLIAFADLVVSAGGTMNREAVALGTPVFTTFDGKLGAVDEQLINDGRMKMLQDPSEVVLSKRSGDLTEVDNEANGSQRQFRDPRLFTDLLLSPVAD